MALIKCIECAKYVSDKESACPHCKTSIGKSHPMINKDIGSKWEAVGLFMASTGALTFLLPELSDAPSIIMVVSGLIVYGFGKFLIGKYI